MKEPLGALQRNACTQGLHTDHQCLVLGASRDVIAWEVSDWGMQFGLPRCLPILVPGPAECQPEFFILMKKGTKRHKGLGNMVLFNYSVFSPLGSAVRAEGDLIF